MTTWDAARLANRRPLPKPRKQHEPVGDAANNERADNDRTCRPCGHLWCSCTWVLPPYGTTDQGIPINCNPYILRGHAHFLQGLGIQCGLLRQTDLEKVKHYVPPECPADIEDVL